MDNRNDSKAKKADSTDLNLEIRRVRTKVRAGIALSLEDSFEPGPGGDCRPKCLSWR